MNSFISSLPFLLQGVPVTVGVSVLAMALSIPVAFLLALGRMSKWAALRWPAGFFIEFFRGTSALVQLFWAFYVLPFFGIPLSPLAAGVLVLTLNEGAYFSEIVRASLGSVLKGQRDAVTALHLPRAYSFFRIMLPQALPLVVPPFGNAAVGMLKFSALVSLVTLQDLSFKASWLRGAGGNSLAIYSTTLLIYFALSLLTIAAVHQLELIVNRRAGRVGTAGIGLDPTGSMVRSSAPGRRSPVPRWALGR